MTISSFLAQVLGIIFLVVGISIVLKKKYAIAAVDEITHNKGLLWLCGFSALAMGAVMVVLNNFWTTGLPLFITVLGWLAILKGAFLLLLPEYTASLYRKINKGGIFIAAGFVCFILGLIMIYVGTM